MDTRIWLRLLAHLTASMLIAQGKTEQGGLLTDALKAADAGKNVDDLLQAAAERWITTGEPTLDELVATRQEIQSRID